MNRYRLEHLAAFATLALCVLSPARLHAQPTGTISIDDVTLQEGNAGTTNAVFTVSITNSPFTFNTTVDFATSDGTATAGSDYQQTTGTVTLPPGDSSATLAVPVIGDTTLEGDETFTVTLSNPPAGAFFGQAQGIGTIVNDDAAPGSVRLASTPRVGESNGAATVVLERIGNLAGTAQVDFSTGSGSATAGQDYQPVSTTVQWQNGEGGMKTVEVPILDDNLEEPNERVPVALSGAVGASLGSPSSGEIVILDDDTPSSAEVVGEDQPDFVVDRQAGLAVRIVGAAGQPIEGAAVEWSVEGAAELVGETISRSNAEGIASITLRAGSVPGLARVTARLVSTGQILVFDVSVAGDLQELFADLPDQPGEASVAGVLDQACITATSAFAPLCNYLFNLPDDATQRAALGEITPEETPAQGTMSLDSSYNQLRNVGSRLAALRGSGTRQAITQLALTIGGNRVPFEAIVSSVANYEEDPFPDFEELLQEAEGAEPTPYEVEDPPRWGFFVNGRLSMGDRPETAAEEGFEVESTGLTLGLDYRVNARFVLGGALGYLDTDLDLNQDGGGLDAEGESLALYAMYFREAFYAEWVFAYGENDYDLVRHIDLAVPFAGQNRLIARGQPGSEQNSATFSLGYDAGLGASSLGVFARGSWVDATVDGYEEAGAGPFNLRIREQELESLLGEVGLDYSYAASYGWGVLQPSLRLAYLHEFEDDSRLIRGQFVNDVQALEFLLPTDDPDRDFFNVGAGLTFVFPRGQSFYLYYDTDLERDDLELETISGGFRWEF